MDFLRTALRTLPHRIINYNKNANVRSILIRGLASQTQNQVTENEIMGILKSNFPAANNIDVQDVSGGCGAMFNVLVETKEFTGLSVIKQHRKVYDILNKQIKNIHGIHLETRIPK